MRRSSASLLAVTASLLGFVALFAASSSLAACDVTTTDAEADGGVTCGSTTCTSTQVCAYRECTDKERCQVRTQCNPSETPTVCPSGQPGCLLAQCGPVVDGCKDVPSTCKSDDVQCACNSLCGSSAACSKVDGRNIDCAATK